MISVNNKRISVKLNKRLYKDVELLCKGRGESMSKYIANLVEEHILQLERECEDDEFDEVNELYVLAYDLNDDDALNQLVGNYE